ncbi:MAG: hypothetical protein Q8J99_16265 [Sulfuritalea sp.]|nr:hypothetical protein [Sulfuritalea sp.]
MSKQFVCMAAALVVLPMSAIAAEDPADIAAVVAAVKAANSDFKALCQKGPDAIRKATTEAVMAQMAGGKIKGNPQAVGGEAGQALGRECRG